MDRPDPAERLTAPSSGRLTFVKSLPKNFQFDDIVCSLDAKDRLVVSTAGFERRPNTEEPAPALARAEETRGFPTEDDAHIP
jgi:hypothetical protein